MRGRHTGFRGQVALNRPAPGVCQVSWLQPGTENQMDAPAYRCDYAVLRHDSLFSEQEERARPRPDSAICSWGGWGGTGEQAAPVLESSSDSAQVAAIFNPGGLV